MVHIVGEELLKQVVVQHKLVHASLSFQLVVVFGEESLLGLVKREGLVVLQNTQKRVRHNDVVGQNEVERVVDFLKSPSLCHVTIRDCFCVIF